MRPGAMRVQHAELLRHLERRVVRQHDSRAADADARGDRGDGRHQDLGRGADDGVVAVVLGDPEAVVAQRLAMPGERDRIADRHPVRASDDGDRLVEH